MSWPPRDNQQDAPWAQRLTALRRDVIEQGPDLIVVSGDVANNHLWELQDEGLEKSWRHARSFLEDVAKHAVDTENYAERVFVIPGNHDAKVLGNVSRDEIRKVVGSRTFRSATKLLSLTTRYLLKRSHLRYLDDDLAAVFSPRLREALESLPAESRLFNEVFGSWATSRFVSSLDLYVLCISSNVENDSALNFAQGAVPFVEAERMRSCVSQWRRDNSLYAAATKLVLVHHHPLPIPYAEGLGGVLDRDQFHLMRNAGTFLRSCLEADVDFVLHGHKHASGCSRVAFPSTDLNHRSDVIVVGAASVQVPTNNACSYNVLARTPESGWQLLVRTREDREEGISPYREERSVTLISAEAERERQWRAASGFKIAVNALDIIGDLDETGDLALAFYADDVRPIDKKELKTYEVLFSSEAKTALIENVVGLKDENPRPNILSGRIRIAPPATPTDGRDLVFNFDGIGMITFSQEYCRWHKGQDFEEFGFGIFKRYGCLRIELRFPAEYPPNAPELQVLRIVDLTVDDDKSINQLLSSGAAVVDDAETAFCADKLKYWEASRRLFLEVPTPLPHRWYRIIWRLAPDEFAVLPDDDSAVHSLRARTRAAVTRLRECFLATAAAYEKQCTQAFLESCGTSLLAAFECKDDFRVDLATNRDAEVQVVAAAACQQGVCWATLPGSLSCKLGETARGRALLERRIVDYVQGRLENVRSPNLHADERRSTKLQVSIPLVWPVSRYSPRIGVLTFSSDKLTSPLLENLLDRQHFDTVVSVVHEQLRLLAETLQCPLPEYV